ncbi:hypothetical protein [Pseudomonas sp. JG-B]|uniref:hypothetical protein n=1 Tax=Pseudomonas sp. JG-B TaxID=2603214 RepID=UPI00129E0B8F|nr:hypothetical protein [Pseudomonas sp. JG-B]MRK21539.1 hypothetical protein [Pseudomonas sp. JG-B]
MYVTLNREQLLAEVWAEPIQRVAPRYGLSDVGLKKLCARLQVPTPGRGYWAKLKAGKRVPSPPTIKPYTGNPRYLHRYVPERSADPDLTWEPRLQAILMHERDPANHILVAGRLSRPHFLVRQWRAALKEPFRDRRGFPLPSARALDVRVSEAMQARAGRLMDALIKAVERRGYRIEVHDQCTQLELLGVSLDLQLLEDSVRRPYEPTPRQRAQLARGESVYLPQWQFVPTGKLTIQAAHGFAGRIADSARAPIEEKLNALIVMMGRWAVKTLVEREERERLAAERRAQREIALAQKALQEAERQRLRQLEIQARNWRRALLIRDYIAAAELQQHGEMPVEQRQYLDWARAKADWLDPLVRAPDELLDLQIEIPRQDGW